MIPWGPALTPLGTGNSVKTTCAEDVDANPKRRCTGLWPRSNFGGCLAVVIACHAPRLAGRASIPNAAAAALDVYCRAIFHVPVAFSQANVPLPEALAPVTMIVPIKLHDVAPATTVPNAICPLVEIVPVPFAGLRIVTVPLLIVAVTVPDRPVAVYVPW